MCIECMWAEHTVHIPGHMSADCAAELSTGKARLGEGEKLGLSRVGHVLMLRCVQAA